MIDLGTTAIIGGGCYGSFYLEQLRKARTAGAATWHRLLVIDRNTDCQARSLAAEVVDAEVVVADWDAFLDDWLGSDSLTDADRIVPSPLMPHLMAAWLHRRAAERWPDRQVEMSPVTEPFGTPFDWLNPKDGVRYVSHADWICPTHCIEPARCPAIRAPRTWEMGETVATWAAGRSDPTVVALFTCRHVAHGVGMYRAARAREALAGLIGRVQEQGSADMAIGSVSACHGAIALLRVGPAGT